MFRQHKKTKCWINGKSTKLNVKSILEPTKINVESMLNNIESILSQPSQR